MNTRTALLSIGLLLGAMMLLPGASADHGYGPEPEPYTASVCHTDIWAGNGHIAPTCHELWTCMSLATPRQKEIEVRNTYYTAYLCAPGPATGPVLASPGLGADAPPNCNGFWYAEKTVGPVTVWTDGSRTCTGVRIDRLEDDLAASAAPGPGPGIPPCYASNIPEPVKSIIDVEGSLSRCTTTITIGRGLCPADGFATFTQDFLTMRVATCFLAATSLPGPCDILQNVYCDHLTDLVFREPNDQEAGVCTDHLGGGILSLPDTCVTFWYCLGSANATHKGIGTPLGTFETQRCIPGPATGPAI